MDRLLKDLSLAARSLRRTPGFTGVAVLCLALGVGVNTTVFSTLNALVLRPLPFAEPERLVSIHEVQEKQGDTWDEISYPNFVDWTTESGMFAGAGAYFSNAVNLADSGTPAYVQGAQVTAGLFRLLGVEPVLGREFRPEEDRVGGERVAVLSHALWRSRFGSDPGVVGRQIRLNGSPHTVVGVMPEGFAFPESQELWVPLARDPEANRGSHSYRNVARLKPGVTVEEAAAALAPVTQRLQAEFPGSNTALSAKIVPFRSDLVPGEVQTVLYVMLGAVGFVLLIACANVAGLLLARGTGRQKELAIRAAIGAGRGDLVRQLLVESLLLALLGGALGVVLAVWGVDAIVASIPETLPYWVRFGIDGRVLLFTLATSLATGLVFGLAPALRASRPELGEVLKEGGRGASGGRSSQRVRSGLVVSQLALSLVLLAGAALMIRSFLAMQRVEPGFEADGMVALRVQLAGPQFDSASARLGFLRGALREIEALPGVESATAVNYLPLAGSTVKNSFEIEGRTSQPGQAPHAIFAPVLPGYFRTMGIPLLQGREITAQEALTGAPVAVVSRAMAERFWPSESAIGKRVQLGGEDDPWSTVVGIAADVRHEGLGEAPEPQVYTPYATWASRSMTLVVRAGGGDPAALIPSVRAAVRRVNGSLALYEAESVRAMVDRSLWDRRLYGWMFAGFAAIALLLAAVGVYGVIAYTVAQRTRELGIRVALGAEPRALLGMVVAQGMKLTAIGMVIGVTLALGVTRVLSGVLYGVTATDVITFASVPLLLTGVALLASYLPARRVTRVDPMSALRAE